MHAPVAYRRPSPLWGLIAFTLVALVWSSRAVAASPFAGTYRATLTNVSGTLVTLTPAAQEFSIEEDGTFTISTGLSGVVSDDGAVTFDTGSGAVGLTYGQMVDGSMTATQWFPAAHSGLLPTISTLSGPRIAGLLPTWTKATLPAGLPSFFNLSLAQGNGLFAALENTVATTSNWNLLTSTDGATWIARPIDLGVGVQSRIYTSPLRFLNGAFRFAAFGDSLGGPTIHVYSSTDGVSWTTVDTGVASTRIVTDLTYAYGRYWLSLTGVSPVEALSSADGVIWDTVVLSADASKAVARWEFGGGVLLGFSSGSQGINPTALRTTDGITWSSLALPDPYYVPYPVMYGDGHFVSSVITTRLSDDFLTSSVAAPGPNNTSDGYQAYSPFRAGLFGDGAFYAISGITNGALYRSADGNEWYKIVRTAPGASTAFYPGALAVAGGVAVCAEQQALWWSLPGEDGVPVVAPPVQSSTIADQTVAIGGYASFQPLFAHQGLILSYQWQHDGVDIAGETNGFLVVGPATAASGGLYTLVATNAAGSTVSSPMKVTISNAPSVPVLTSMPSSQTVMEGASFTLSVQATGGSLSYQWRKDGVPVAGATSRNYTFTAAVGSAGDYDCVVSNALGTVTSVPAHLTVIAGLAPVATGAPRLLDLSVGGSAVISANITGAQPITYQWTRDGVPIDGQTGTSLVLNPISESTPGTYRVLAINAYGSVLGVPNVVTLRPALPFEFLGHPAVRIADNSTARPGSAGHTLGVIGTVRFRGGSVVFQASEVGTTANGLFRWHDDAFQVIADTNLTAPNGQSYLNCTSPTEESDGVVYFVASHAAAPTSVLYVWRAGDGAITPLVAAGDAAPGGGHFSTFSYLAARGGTLYFLGFIADRPLPGNRLYRRTADGAISLVLSPSTDLPGPMGNYAGEVSGTQPFAYDGQRLVAALVDQAGASGLFEITDAGAITPLLTSYDLRPGTLFPLTPVGNGDVEPDGPIVAGSSVYEAVFAADHTPLSLTSDVRGNVTAAGPGAFLRYGTSGDVTYREGLTSLPVVLSGQVIDGFAPQTVVPEADGLEAAFRVAYSSSSVAVYVVVDKPAIEAPVITFQPRSLSADLGAAVYLSVAAGGGGLQWQWYHDGLLVPGATRSILPLPALSVDDLGNYTVEVSNALGSATSDPASVSLVSDAGHAPVIVVQPVDQRTTVGTTVTVAALVDAGASTTRYAWYRDTTQVGNSSSLSFAKLTSADFGVYHLVVTNAYGSTTSRDVTLSDASVPLEPMVPDNFAATDLTVENGVISFVVPTLMGQTYRVEMSTTLADGSWTEVETFTGDGGERLCGYAYAGGSAFYRVVITGP